MPHPSGHVFCSGGVLRLVLVLAGLFMVACIGGPPLLWRLFKGSSAEASCGSCSCDCSSDAELSFPIGIISNALADCGKHDRDVSEELEKDIIDLTAEELALRKRVSEDTLKSTMALTMNAKRASSHFQKEAEKCNAGVETCEEARERAEARLIEERKLAELWERRARQFGW